MKIKSISKDNNFCDIARYNPNTVGTHILIHEGEESQSKRDYSNIALITLMLERGFFHDDFDSMVTSSEEFVSDYEKNDIMGL